VRPTARRAGMGPCGGAQENGPAAPPDRRNHRAVPGCHRGWPRRPSRRSRLLGVAGTEGNGPHGAGSGRVELRVFAGAVVGCRWRAFGSGPRGRRGGVPRRPAAWPGPDSRPAPPRRARLRAVYLYMRRRPPGPGAGRPPAPLTPDGREGRRTLRGVGSVPGSRQSAVKKKMADLDSAIGVVPPARAPNREERGRDGRVRRAR
jgi:hypothetical protein